MKYVLLILSTLASFAQTDAHVVDSIGINNNPIFVNDGTGLLNDFGQVVGNFEPTFSAAYGDLDGDSDIDLINGSDPSCRVYLNDGSGNFSNGQQFDQDLAIVQSVAVADVDQDGDLDAILGVKDSQFTSQCQIYLNDGNANFSLNVQFGNHNTQSIAVANLNGDAFPDIFEAIRDEPDKVWLNNGDGTFTDSGQALGSGPSMAVCLGDVNGDTFLDAFVAHDGGANRLWINDGLGNMTDSMQLFPNQNSLSASFGDMNRDGHLDIVVGQDGAINGDEMEVWLNDGSGNFSLVNQTIQTDRTLGITLGDIDSDGDLDVMAANIGGTKIWMNNGTGLLNLTQSINGGQIWSGVLTYLSDPYNQAHVRWEDHYNILGLLNFERHLTATDDHQRAR